MFSKNKTYNGYKNYETWNVALFINNNIEVYEEARICADYRTFVKWMGWGGVYKTTDGIDLDCSELDIHELDGVLKEL